MLNVFCCLKCTLFGVTCIYEMDIFYYRKHWCGRKKNAYKSIYNSICNIIFYIASISLYKNIIGPKNPKTLGYEIKIN